jgi:hypothetical protein
VVVILTVNPGYVTPHTEGFHVVAWLCWVSHPKLQLANTKWDGFAESSARSRMIGFFRGNPSICDLVLMAYCDHIFSLTVKVELL